jgi:predicted dehydrogenase
MRIGIIGLGGMYRILRRALRKLDQPIAAVCDLDEGKVQQAALDHTAIAYTEHEEMLDREWLDAVFIALPPGAHTTQVQDAARARCAVFMTPPCALELEKAVETANVLRATGVINEVGYRARYSDIALEARVLIRNRPLTLGFGRFLCRMSPSHPWWGKKEMSGGQLVDQSTHVFDLLRLFMGEVEAVQAFGHLGGDKDLADFEDSTTVNVHFKSGAVGNVVSTSISRAAEGFAAEFSGKDVFARLLFDNQLSGWIDGDPIDYTGDEEGYRRQVEVFLRAVKEKNQALLRSPYEDAVRTLAVTLAATRSLQTGKIEPVPHVVFADPPAEEAPAQAASAT